MKRLIVLLLCLSVLYASGIGAAVSAADAVVVRVGVYDNQPKIFTDDSGEVTGFWPDIINYIALEEGWEIEYVHGTWTECLDRLKNHEIDIMPDVAYSEDRAELYDFSNETVYVSWSMVYTRQGADIQSIPDLEGKTIAVLKDSINVEGPNGIKKLVSSFSVNCAFIELDSYLKVFEMLENGEADAGVVSKDFAYNHETEFRVKETAIVFQPALLYFTFPKGASLNPYLIDKIDNCVKQLKADGDSIYYQSVGKWFGGQPVEKPVLPVWLKWVLIGTAGLVFVLAGGALILRHQVRVRTKELAEDIEKRKKTEKVLRASEEKYRVTLDSMMEGCQIIDFHWRYVYLNDTAVEHGRQPREKLLGSTMMDMYPGIEDTEMFANLKRCMETRVPHRMENLFKYPDGSENWFDLSIEPVPEGVFVLSINTTERKRAEQERDKFNEQLQESLQFNSSVLENSPHPILVRKPDTSITYVNPALEKLTGYSSGELTGEKNVFPFWTEEQLKEHNGNIEKVIRRGIYKRERQFTKKNKEPFWVELTTTPVRSKGQINYLISNWTDITERKRTEEALQSMTTRMEGLLAAIPDIIMEVDNNKVYTWANQAGIDFFGDDVIGKEAAFYFEGEQDTYNVVKPLFNGEESTFYVESWQRRKDGQKRLLAWWCRVLKDNRGNVTGALSSAQDITERNLIEKALQASEVKYRRLFEAARDGILLLNAETGLIVDVNPFLVEMLGFSHDEFLGKKIWELGLLKDIIANKDNFIELQRKGYVRYEGLPLETAAGQRLEVEFVSNVYNVDHQKIIQCDIRDITERKKAQKAQERLSQQLQSKVNELETFSYGIAHDLKSPLVSIEGFSRLLREDLQNQKAENAQEDIRLLETGVRRMQDFINKTLAYSRAEHLIKRTKDVSFRKIVNELITEFGDQVSSIGATISVADKFPRVYADAIRITEVLTNLIQNSIKYRDKTVPLKIEIGYNPSENGGVFFVRDNGLGIEPGEEEKVFTMFYRGTADNEGSGIGLAIVKKIIEAHGGKVWVQQNQSGKGTTMCFTLSQPDDTGKGDKHVKD